MEEKLLNQVAMKIETCIDMQNGATEEQLQDILLDVNTLKSYMGFKVNGVQASHESALHKHIVSQQRELLYGFITWYNSKPKVQKGEHVYTTDVDEFLKP